MARQKEKAEKRHRELRVLSTDEEIASYRAAAAKIGTTVASWVRITLRRTVGLDRQ